MAGVIMTHASTTAGAGSAHGAELCSEKPSKYLPDVHQLLKERRARLYEMQATAGRPLTQTLLRAYTQYSARLARHDCPIPDDVVDAVYALLNALEAPVNALTDRLDGPSTPEERARDRTAERYAAARRRLSRAHHRIATGAATTAIQQRYIRAVRRTVHRRILRTLEAYEGPPLVYGGQLAGVQCADRPYRTTAWPAIRAARRTTIPAAAAWSANS